MERRNPGRILAGLVITLLLVTLAQPAFASYGFHDSTATATVQNPTVTLGAVGLTLDGHAVSAASCTSSCALSITTTMSFDVILVLVEGNPGVTACSVSDVLKLTWNVRYACQNTPNSGSPPVTRAYGAYWAVATNPLAADSVTVTITGGPSFRILIFAVNGANTVSPFDTNANLPSAASANSPSGCVMTTSNAIDFLFSTAQQGGTPSYTAPPGFTPIDQTTFGEESEDAYQVVSTTQSGVTETWTGTAGANIVSTCDAIVSASNLASTVSLNTAAQVSATSPVLGTQTTYYENANAATSASGCPASPSTNTQTTAPGGTGSFTLTTQAECLYSPVFARATPIPANTWSSTFWAQTLGTGYTISITLYFTTPAGATTLIAPATLSPVIPSSKGPVVTSLSGSAVVVPAGDYLELKFSLTPCAGPCGTVSIYWGAGQLTNFVQPLTFGYFLVLNNPSSTAWLVNLGYVSSTNLGRLSNMTSFFQVPISKQVILGSGVTQQLVGPQVTLAANSKLYLGLTAMVSNFGTTTITLSLKIQVSSFFGSVTPYCQDTIVITVT